MNGSTPGIWLVSATLLALSVSVVACGGVGGSSPPVATASASETSAPSPSASPVASAVPASAGPTAQPSPDIVAVKAYFLHVSDTDGSTALVPVDREVQPTDTLATAAIQALLAGPTDAEREHDPRLGSLDTSIPQGTRLLGLDIQNGTATVDLSGEFASGDILGAELASWASRLAQVTYTLTQFPTVDGVRFKVDGEPTKAIEGHEGTAIDRATRAAYTDQLPPIFVDQPAWGAAVTDPLTVAGIAQILAESPHFEAAIVDRTTDKIIVQQTVRAPCATGGCWQPPGGGPFEIRFSIPGGADQRDLLLRVWEVSAADGSPIHVLEYPLR